MMTRDDLSTWGIALVDLSQGYVGQIREVDHVPGEVRLSPAYAFLGGYQISPQGVGRMRLAVPIEMLADERSITVRFNTLLRLSTMSAGDFAEVSKWLLESIDQAEKIRYGIRAKRAGVVLAPVSAVRRS